MEYRFSLDTHMDADLIAAIEKKSNGGSRNRAMKFMVRYMWDSGFGQPAVKIRPKSDQNPSEVGGLEAGIFDDLSAAISIIDSDFDPENL